MKYFIAKQRYLESHHDVAPKAADKSKEEETMRRDSSASNSNMSFDQQDPNTLLTSLKPDGTFEIDVMMFDDGVELSDLTKNYREMVSSLDSFKEQKQALQSLRIGDDT